MQMKMPKFQLAHLGSLLRLQSAQTRLPGSLSSDLMTFWLAAAFSAAGFNRRDMAVATTDGGLGSRAAASRGRGGVAGVSSRRISRATTLLCWDGVVAAEWGCRRGIWRGVGAWEGGCEGGRV